MANSDGFEFVPHVYQRSSLQGLFQIRAVAHCDYFEFELQPIKAIESYRVDSN
jgi:hypothetical protein